MTTTLDPRHAAEFDVVGAVRQATTEAKTRRKTPVFSLTHGTPREAGIAIVLGFYLAYAVGRLPEVFAGIDVIPHLPMIMMGGFLATLVYTVPRSTWKELWAKSMPTRYVTWLGTLGIATAPFGIYMSGSVLFFRTQYVISLAVFFCCLIFLRDRRNFRRAVAIYVFSLGCVAAATLVKTYTAPPPPVELDEYGNLIAYNPNDQNNVNDSRVVVGVSLDSNDFGCILAVTFPLALWLGVGSLRRRLFWSGIALVLMAAVVPTASRGTMLGFGAVATVLIGVGASGWRRFVTLGMVGVGVAIFFATVNSGQLDRFTDFRSTDYNLTSGQGRWRFWEQGFIWMLRRPWGSGINMFPTKFDSLNGTGRAAHSLWVQYGMELGVAGLVLFILLCTGLIKRLLAMRQRAVHAGAQDPRAKEEEQLAGHLVAMIVGLMVTGTFISIAYSPVTYMCIGIAAAALLGSTLPETLPNRGVGSSEPQLPAPGRRIRHPVVVSRAR